LLYQAEEAQAIAIRFKTQNKNAKQSSLMEKHNVQALVTSYSHVVPFGSAAGHLDTPGHVPTE
jgi:hypothetical protein